MQNPFKQNMIPHNHDWEMLSKTYASPAKLLPNSSISDELMEKLLMGLTTLVSRCKICQEMQKEEIIGTDESQLDETLDKVDAFGPQYLYRGDNTYMVGLVPKEPEYIPVR